MIMSVRSQTLSCVTNAKVFGNSELCFIDSYLLSALSVDFKSPTMVVKLQSVHLNLIHSIFLPRRHLYEIRVSG